RSRHCVLVVIRLAGDGRAAPRAVETQWRTRKRKEFVPRGMRAAQGKLFSLEGCGHEAQGTAAPSPGFTTRQGRKGRPVPNGAMADSAPRVTGVPACALMRARPTTHDKARGF